MSCAVTVPATGWSWLCILSFLLLLLLFFFSGVDGVGGGIMGHIIYRDYIALPSRNISSADRFLRKAVHEWSVGNWVPHRIGLADLTNGCFMAIFMTQIYYSHDLFENSKVNWLKTIWWRQQNDSRQRKRAHFILRSNATSSSIPQLVQIRDHASPQNNFVV